MNSPRTTKEQFIDFAGDEPEEWQPIETAPKDGTVISILFESGRDHKANWRTTYGGEWHVDDLKYLPWADQQCITHWRPLKAEVTP